MEQLAAELAELRKKDLSSQKKQQRVALDTLRKNELCENEEKHKSSPANVMLITIIKKASYNMDDILTSWNTCLKIPKIIRW